MRLPTLPVTQTAALVTHEVTPRMTKSPAACAALPARSPAVLQTKSTPGRSHGFGIEAARAGVVPGPTATTVDRTAASVAAATRIDRLRLGMREDGEARDLGEEVTGRGGIRRLRKWRRRTRRTGERRDLPPVLPHERHGL